MSIALERLLGADLRHDEPLAKYTAARLGGPAQMLYVAKASTERLAHVVQAAWDADIPVRVLGGGANVLVSDAGVDGLVVINQVKEIKFGDWHDGRTVNATAGVSLTTLANRCAMHGLGGFEWAISVPGTLGGAIVNNAGAHGADMHAAVRDIIMLDAERGAVMRHLEDLQYDYRTSALKQREDKRFLVLMANLALPPEDRVTIRQRMREFQAYRKRTQPPGASLGSIFKNPPGDYAGRLIEAAGLKGYAIGDAAVSEVHANFLINQGRATASDYYALIQHVQAQVHAQSGILLEPEIEFVGKSF